jgi:hypothetical protein
MKMSVLFTLLFCSHISLANEVIGTITKLKGDVSILELGKRDAYKAAQGQNVTKEASLLTQDKSFVQIVMLDKTQINLGPNSKIVLDKTPIEKIGLISLMKGALRTNVIKELGGKDGKDGKGGRDKFYIKTRTAALGIRGTDFLTNFNPENKMTNLITFRGSVAMVKTESSNVQSSLESQDVVMVESGKFATISNNLKNATEPVKLSPVQYTGLKLNEEMDVESKISNDVFQAELKETIKEYAEISKKEIALNNLAKQEYDPQKQVLRPTAGGVVDLVTGIYVPPSTTQNSYNKELNIYELKAEKGEVTESGVYIPPKGFTLDAKKGFVANALQAESAVHAELKILNNDISGQIKKPAKPKKEDLGGKSEDAYEKYFIKE